MVYHYFIVITKARAVLDARGTSTNPSGGHSSRMTVHANANRPKSHRIGTGYSVRGYRSVVYLYGVIVRAGQTLCLAFDRGKRRARQIVVFLFLSTMSSARVRVESGWATTGAVRSASPRQRFIFRCSTPVLGILGREDYLGYASRGHHIRHAQAFTETSDFRHRQYLVYVYMDPSFCDKRLGYDRHMDDGSRRRNKKEETLVGAGEGALGGGAGRASTGGGGEGGEKEGQSQAPCLPSTLN